MCVCWHKGSLSETASLKEKISFSQQDCNRQWLFCWGREFLPAPCCGFVWLNLLPSVRAITAAVISFVQLLRCIQGSVCNHSLPLVFTVFPLLSWSLNLGRRCEIQTQTFLEQLSVYCRVEDGEIFFVCHQTSLTHTYYLCIINILHTSVCGTFIWKWISIVITQFIVYSLL